MNSYRNKHVKLHVDRILSDTFWTKRYFAPLEKSGLKLRRNAKWLVLKPYLLEWCDPKKKKKRLIIPAEGSLWIPCSQTNLIMLWTSGQYYPVLSANPGELTISRQPPKGDATWVVSILRPCTLNFDMLKINVSSES